MKETKGRIHFAWIVLLGVCIVMGLARGGLNSAGGLFTVPVTAELKFGTGEFMLYFSISSVVTFLFLPVAGKLASKYDMRPLLVVGIVLQAGSFALFGCMRNIWGWYLLSIPLSAGSVITTQIAGPILINNWFKKHNGLAVGIMMAAVGLLGAILQPMTGNLITTQGWRRAYIILGCIVMAVGIPTVLLMIRSDPAQRKLNPIGCGDSVNANSSSAAINTHGVAEKDARKSVSFWALTIFMFLITAAAAFAQHVPQFANQMGYDTSFAGGAMGYFMVGMFIGALLFGWLSDRIGACVTAIIALTCGIVAILIAIFFGSQPMLFNLAIMLFGIMSSSVGTLGPLLTSVIFGQREYGGIYAAVAMGMAFAGIVAIPSYGFVYDATQDYVPVLWMIIGFLALCAFCIVIAFAGKRKLERDGFWR